MDWRKKAKEGFSNIVDLMEDGFRGTKHVRLDVGEDVQVTGLTLDEDRGNRLFQVVLVMPNGEEEIAEQCLSETAAMKFVESFNYISPPNMQVAEARQYQQSHGRDELGKVHSLLVA